MKMKKIVALVIASSMVFGVVGCASKSAMTQKEEKSKIVTTIDKPVEIEFWHAMTGENEETLKKITGDFNAKEKNIKVKLVLQGQYKELFSKLDGASKAKNLPAMTMIYPNRLTAFIMNDLVEDLTPYIEDKKVGFTKEEFDDIPAFIRDNGTWNGKHYSLPFNKSTYVLFYNKDLLEKNSIKVPTTWDELRDASKKLTKDTNGDGKNEVYGLALNQSVGIDSSFWVEQAGGHLIDEAKDQLLFNSPETVSAYDFITGMTKEGIAKIAGEEKYITGPFGRGEAAMAIASTSVLPDVEKICKGNKINFDTAVLPKGKKEAALFAGTDVAVFNTSTAEQKLAAWKYIKFFMEKENTTYWGMKSGYLPLRKSAMKSEEFKNHVKKDSAKGNAIKEFEYGFCDPKVLNGYAIHDNMDKALQEVIQGKKTSKEALQEAEKKARQELDDAKKSFGK